MTQPLSLSPDVRQWIADHLESGHPPADIVATMCSQGIDRDYATAAVATFSSRQRPTPTFADGPVLSAPDRVVPVLARLPSPRIAVLGEVMDAAECAALIALARPRLAPSTVIEPESGHDVVASYRGSEGMFFRLQETPLVSMLDARLSALLRLPVSHGEGLQVLRYPAGAESAPHFDFLPDTNAANRASIARSGQRLATLIVYLNTVEAGGETVFPELGLSVQPHCGHGLCFEYTQASGELDVRSLHAGAPVLQGEKWIVTKWMRSRPFVSRGA